MRLRNQVAFQPVATSMLIAVGRDAKKDKDLDYSSRNRRPEYVKVVYAPISGTSGSDVVLPQSSSTTSSSSSQPQPQSHHGMHGHGQHGRGRDYR